jgi:hypothetical protein
MRAIMSKSRLKEYLADPAHAAFARNGLGLPEDASTEDIIKAIDAFNADPERYSVTPLSRSAGRPFPPAKPELPGLAIVHAVATAYTRLVREIEIADMSYLLKTLPNQSHAKLTQQAEEIMDVLVILQEKLGDLMPATRKLTSVTLPRHRKLTSVTP